MNHESVEYNDPVGLSLHATVEPTVACKHPAIQMSAIRPNFFG